MLKICAPQCLEVAFYFRARGVCAWRSTAKTYYTFRFPDISF